MHFIISAEVKERGYSVLDGKEGDILATVDHPLSIQQIIVPLFPLSTYHCILIGKMPIEQRPEE